MLQADAFTSEGLTERERSTSDRDKTEPSLVYMFHLCEYCSALQVHDPCPVIMLVEFAIAKPDPSSAGT